MSNLKKLKSKTTTNRATKKQAKQRQKTVSPPAGVFLCC
jgi:hypothetical protein